MKFNTFFRPALHGVAAFFVFAPIFAGPQEDFMAAMKRDNLKVAQKIFTAGGINVNLADEKGKSPVQYACENGSVTAFAWLAEQQADLTGKDAEGNNCIHLAISARKPGPMMAAAVEKGIDKNAVNAKNQTPLIMAVALGKKPTADEIIKLQVDLNARDAEGHTALSRSIVNRRQDLALMLIQAGASPNSEQNAPLNLAYDGNQWKVFDALVKASANLNITYEKTGQPLILEFIKKERIAYAKLLIESGVALELVDEEKNSPLVICAKQTIPDLVAPLVARGLSVETKDPEGKTLLQIAHENNMKRQTPAREKLMKELLNAGANPSTLSPTGRSILMEQSESGRYNQVKHLLEKGADVNFRDKAGNTVLHTTAQRNQLATFGLIVEKFSDVNVTGDSGNTAVHFASRASGVGILKTLKAKGADLELKNTAGETALSIAIGRQDPTTTRTLLALGASLSDAGRETPLMLEIAKSGSVNARTLEILSVLQKAGADLNAVNRFGNNALAYSLSRKNLKMAESFLKAGALADAKDLSGNTLIHKVALSARYNKLKNQELTDWLQLVLSYEHPDFQNNAGETALHIAANKDNNPDIEGAHQVFENLVNFGASVTIADAQGRSVFDRSKKLDWEELARANLPAPAIETKIPQAFNTTDPDKLIGLSATEKDFYAAFSLGQITRVARFNDELMIKGQVDLPSIQAIVATPDGVMVAGVKPGSIDGEADKKCRANQNLVVYITYLDKDLAPKWENTWGKSGSCLRSAALALGYDSQGNTLIYAEFSGRRSIRKINSSGGLETTEISRSDRTSELQVTPQGQVVLPAANLIYNPEDGKNIGKISKNRYYKYIALAPNGIRYHIMDYNKLSARRGVTLTAEDSESKALWSKNFASDLNMSMEMIVATDERICFAGKTDDAMHGQPFSATAEQVAASKTKIYDYYVVCTNNQGTRVFTRLIPSGNMQLVDFKLNKKGALALVFQTQDRKNPDILLYRIDKDGKVFN